MSTSTSIASSQPPQRDFHSKTKRGDGMTHFLQRESGSRSIIPQNGQPFHEHRVLRNGQVAFHCCSRSTTQCRASLRTLNGRIVRANGKRNHSPAEIGACRFVDVNAACTFSSTPSAASTSYSTSCAASDIVAMGKRLLDIHNFGRVMVALTPPVQIDTPEVVAALIADGDKENRKPPPRPVWVGGRPWPTATTNVEAASGQLTREKEVTTLFGSKKPTCNDECDVDAAEHGAISFLMSGNSLYMTSKRFGVEQSTIRAWLKARKRREEAASWKNINNKKRKRGRPPILKGLVVAEPILLTPLLSDWHQNISPYVEKEQNRSEPSAPPIFCQPKTLVDLEQERISCEWRQIVEETMDRSFDAQQSRLRRDYQIAYNSMLGEGHYGRVYLAIRRTEPKEEFAIKIVSKELVQEVEGVPLSADALAWNRYCYRELKREVVLLRCLRHGALNRLRDFFETPNKVYLVMERMSGGDLMETIMRQKNNRMDELTTKFYTWQVLCALRFLHQRGIAHYDIKPENVLLADHSRTASSSPPRVRAVVCDLGHARFVDTRRHRHFFGTTAYAAPEVLAKKDIHTTALDMWGLGVMVCLMLTGCFPFDDDRPMLAEIHRNAPPALFRRDAYWTRKGYQLKDFISRLLSIEPKYRIDAELSLAHDWLAEDTALKAELLTLKRRIAKDTSNDSNGDYLLVD